MIGHDQSILGDDETRTATTPIGPSSAGSTLTKWKIEKPSEHFWNFFARRIRPCLALPALALRGSRTKTDRFDVDHSRYRVFHQISETLDGLSPGLGHREKHREDEYRS